MPSQFWTVLVDDRNVIGRFEKHADAKHLAQQLENRLCCRSRPIRLHHDLSSLRKEMSTR